MNRNLKHLDDWCYKNVGCNLVAWMTADYRDNALVTEFIKYVTMTADEDGTFTSGVTLVSKARAFAIQKHKSQMWGDKPYIRHLELTADEVWRQSYSIPLVHAYKRWALMAAAYLHDTLEDTETTLEELTTEFGPYIAGLVNAVTDGQGESRNIRKAAAYPKMRGNSEATLIKLCDRKVNIINSLNEPKFFEMYKGEHPRFEAALRVHWVFDELWGELANLLYKKEDLK